MRREITREHDGRFCTLKIDTASGRPPHLLITGTSGVVVTEAEAERMVRDCWEAYFNDNPSVAEWFPEVAFLRPYHLVATADLPPKILRAAETILSCDEHDDCRLNPELSAACAAAPRPSRGKHR